MRCLPFFLLALMLAACGSNKVALQGRVVDAYTNQPIEGAMLKIGSQSGVATDANGSYTTNDWNAKETLTAEAAGYEATTVKLAEKPELQSPQAQPSPAVNLDLTLRPNTLSGTVTDAFSGQPLTGAVVQVSDTISTTTGTDGSYTLQGIPEHFQVAVAAPNYAPARADLSRQTTYATQLRPDVLHGVVKNSYTSAPIPGVTVKAGNATATTGADGSYELRGIPANAEISFEVDGYDVVRMAQPNTTSYDATLRPNILTGTVIDATTGAPLPQVQLVAQPAPGQNAVAGTRTNEQGQYRLPNVPEGSTVMALLPGYRRAQTVVQQGSLQSELKLEPFDAKALYMTAGLASQGMATVKQYFDVIDRTELNSMILDIKSDSAGDVGKVYYASQVPEVIAAGTVEDNMPIREILAEAKRRNIYMIARVQIMAHDNALLQAHPDWYVQKNGKPWRSHDGMAWLDAFDERVADYNIKLAVEAAQLGFDDIQFDYIRFPSDGNLQGAVFKGPYDPKNPQAMYDAIGRVCERAQTAINNAGAYFGVDVFGYAAWQPMSSIGQNLSIMGKHVDYVYPMVYPSHFVYNELGLGNPDEHPFEIVDHSMKLVKNQLQGEASRAKVRPWLQDFTATWIKGTIKYGPAQVRAQIDATEQNAANGTRGWALWNAQNIYTTSALKPQ
jgi:protocatechuate 3,4-dioxygenase beta subunit